MASKSLSSSQSTLLILLLLFIITPSLGESPEAICKSTPDPSFCKSVLPGTNRSANGYDYTRFSVRKSISEATKFLRLVESYQSPRRRASLSASAVRALEDCRYLANLNVEFLSTSLQNVATTTNETLPASSVDNVQTFLSAILTNQQTCLDGLQTASSSWDDQLTRPLSNDTKLYSVSLALFSKTWRHKARRFKKRSKVARSLTSVQPSSFQNGKLPRWTRKVFESVGRRNLLQAVNNGTTNVLVSNTVVVNQNGTGNFTTIGDAVAAAPNNTDGSKGYFMIYVTAGVYEEYVSIPKNKRYLMMVGDGINQTIITGNRSVVDGWTTFNSATFVVVSPNFVAVNITIRNTAGAIKHQAVALRSGGDFSTFYQCSFEGYQDTLYTHSLRQFYRECDIYGTVDFIFGNAAVVLQNCNIYPRLPMSGQFNAITAQGRTDPNQNTGISIHNCNIRAAPDLAAVGNSTTVKTYLGRPWKEYSRTVYLQNFMDWLIDPAGWRAWNGEFALATLYYAEYENSGPRSDTSARVTWPGYRVITNETDASNYTVSGFLLGNEWIPKTGVAFTADLV
ncbi:Probable pectinesterase/pectinesterase inhibitor 41 [Linum grandiflorum]